MKYIHLNDILSRVKEKYGENLEHYKFYDITDFKLFVDSPEGKTQLISFVIKPGKKSRVVLENGLEIRGSDEHLVNLVNLQGSLQINQLKLGDEVRLRGEDSSSSSSKVVSIEISDDEVEDFYDVEVSNETKLYYTADGICHHNTGKTFNVEATLGKMGLSDGNGFFKNTGSASAAGIYLTMFLHRDGVLLFDDSDDALKDQASRNLFKAATDTRKVRKLSWTKRGSNVVDPDDYEDPQDIVDEGKIPRYFEFTGKIIFISNLKIDKLDPDGALRTRAFMIDIDPTEVEIYDFMEKIAGSIPLEEGLNLSDKDRVRVVSILRKSKSKQAASLRKLVRGLNMYAGSIKAGVSVGDDELRRLIEFYA